MTPTRPRQPRAVQKLPWPQKTSQRPETPNPRNVPAASGPSVVAARLPTAMTANHPEPNPHHCSDKRRDERVEPKRPRKAPEEEVEPDILRVLEHEDEQESRSDERGDSYSAQSAPPLFFHRARRAVTTTLFSHLRVERTQG